MTGTYSINFSNDKYNEFRTAFSEKVFGNGTVFNVVYDGTEIAGDGNYVGFVLKDANNQDKDPVLNSTYNGVKITGVSNTDADSHQYGSCTRDGYNGQYITQLTVVDGPVFIAPGGGGAWTQTNPNNNPGIQNIVYSASSLHVYKVIQTQPIQYVYLDENDNVIGDGVTDDRNPTSVTLQSVIAGTDYTFYSPAIAGYTALGSYDFALLNSSGNETLSPINAVSLVYSNYSTRNNAPLTMHFAYEPSDIYVDQIDGNYGVAGTVKVTIKYRSDGTGAGAGAGNGAGTDTGDDNGGHSDSDVPSSGVNADILNAISDGDFENSGSNTVIVKETINSSGQIEKTITIDSPKGDALSFGTMAAISRSSAVSIVYNYSYEGKDYSVIITPELAEKYLTPSIPWYGPLYLAEYFPSAKSVFQPPVINGTYEIQFGDTLSGIAQKYGLTLEQLMLKNPDIKNPDKIVAGDVINI